MPGKPTVLSEAAFRELRREIHTARQDISNLRRHLAHVSTRRHEAVWMPPPQESIGIPFRNDSGYTIPAHGIIQENGSVTISGTEYVKGIRPDGTPKSLYLVNLEDAVADGATGLGTWLSDAGWLAYNTTHVPAAKESWGPQSGSFLAYRGAPGFYIIGNSDGTIVRARQRVVGRVFAATSEAMSQGGIALCRIISHNGNNFYFPDIDEIEVYDFYMNLGEDDIPVDTKIEATLYDSDVWVLALAYCEASDTLPAGSSGGGTDGGGGGTGTGGSGGAVAGGAPGIGLGDVMLFGPDNFTEPGFLPQEAL